MLVFADSDIQWGSMGEWAAALMGFLAFSVALALFLYQLGVNRAERGDRERQQARLVRCVLNSHDDDRGQQNRCIVVRPSVINNSDEVITDVMVAIHDGQGEKFGAVAMEEVQPHGQETRTQTRRGLAQNYELGGVTFHTLFTDAQGRLWERRRDHSLHRIRE